MLYPVTGCHNQSTQKRRPQSAKLQEQTKGLPQRPHKNKGTGPVITPYTRLAGTTVSEDSRRGAQTVHVKQTAYNYGKRPDGKRRKHLKIPLRKTEPVPVLNKVKINMAETGDRHHKPGNTFAPPPAKHRIKAAPAV